MISTHSICHRYAPLLALVAALTVPMSALAQAPQQQATPVVSGRGTTVQPVPLTRDQVRLDVERAMRDGTWRCRTSSRGWCSNEHSTQTTRMGRSTRSR